MLVSPEPGQRAAQAGEAVSIAIARPTSTSPPSPSPSSSSVPYCCLFVDFGAQSAWCGAVDFESAEPADPNQLGVFVLGDFVPSDGAPGEATPAGAAEGLRVLSLLCGSTEAELQSAAAAATYLVPDDARFVAYQRA